MKKYMPFPFYHDDVPIDISFIFDDEKPAGKHGFLKTDGRRFVFEDGTIARFWGTNLNGGANFPDKSYAETLARRLAKIGINIVRFHQLDAEWNTPNIFAFTKGKRIDKTTELDSESMDRLDYLIYCLKKEGIYCYLDMFTYRKFKTGDGVENPELLNDTARPYCCFSRKLIELQKEMCKKIWTHINPYTKLAYCDEPAIVMAEVVNESDLFSSKYQSISVEPYKSEFLAMFDKWLADNGINRKAKEEDCMDLEDETVLRFRKYAHEAYYREMIGYMRKIGIKIPITGTNWSPAPAIIETQFVTDYVDVHPYFYDWRWNEFEKHCMNTAITQKKELPLATSSSCANENMPMFISEWDVPWPNEYRAESPIYFAAIGMFQGWSGFAIHTYAYSSHLERMNILGKEVSSRMIGGVPYREGIFSTWNDPAKFGLFYHAALITRRGDVAESKKIRHIKPISDTEWNLAPAYDNFEKTKLCFAVDDKADDFKDYKPDTEMKDALSDTKQLYRNWEKNYGYIDTPMTKCAYGFLGKNEALDLSGVKINGITDFGVIAISSLSEKPITESDNILITTVGRAENTDFKAEGELVHDIGRAPVTVEIIESEIEIETSVTGLRVWAINAEGFCVGFVPAKYEGGKFKFKTGETTQSMYYLISKE